MLFGLSTDATSGFFQEKLDLAMMRVVDILYSLPYMSWSSSSSSSSAKHLRALHRLGLVQWLTVARMMRGQVWLEAGGIHLGGEDLGVGSFRIILRHISPMWMEWWWFMPL